MYKIETKLLKYISSSTWRFLQRATCRQVCAVSSIQWPNYDIVRVDTRKYR